MASTERNTIPASITIEQDPSILQRTKKSRRKGSEFLKERSVRLTTFHKRKEGLFKKAYELATLTKCEVVLFLMTETGHGYLFTTRKMKSFSSPKVLHMVEECLNKNEQEN